MIPAKSIFGRRRFWTLLLGSLVVTGLAHGQTSEVRTLSLDGARAVLHAAEQKARELSAPSSLAVVDSAGDLILFEQMPGARPVGIDLAVGKARSAARYQEATQTLEATINTGRPAAVTSGMIQMDGGVPIHVGRTVVGAVGVSGLAKANDIQIAQTAAAALK